MRTSKECLKSYMKKNGYSQRGISKHLGVTEVSVSRYLSEEREPEGDVAEKIAALTHTELTRKDGRWYFRRKYQTQHAS